MMNYMNTSNHAAIISLLDPEEIIVSVLVPPAEPEAMCRNMEL